MNQSTDTPVQSCPKCGSTLDMATCATAGAHTPSVGDATVCLYCAHVMVFAKGMRLREPTAREQKIIERDPRIKKIQQARAAVMQPLRH